MPFSGPSVTSGTQVLSVASPATAERTEFNQTETVGVVNCRAPGAAVSVVPSKAVRRSLMVSVKARLVGQSSVGSKRAVKVVTHRNLPGTLAPERVKGTLSAGCACRAGPKSLPRAITAREKVTVSGSRPDTCCGSLPPSVETGMIDRTSSGSASMKAWAGRMRPHARAKAAMLVMADTLGLLWSTSGTHTIAPCIFKKKWYR